MTRYVLCPLPYRVKDFVREDEDGEPVCILNSRLTREQNVATALHEAEHIQYNDLAAPCDVSDLEADRHKK